MSYQDHDRDDHGGFSHTDGPPAPSSTRPTPPPSSSSPTTTATTFTISTPPSSGSPPTTSTTFTISTPSSTPSSLAASTTPIAASSLSLDSTTLSSLLPASVLTFSTSFASTVPTTFSTSTLPLPITQASASVSLLSGPQIPASATDTDTQVAGPVASTQVAEAVATTQLAGAFATVLLALTQPASITLAQLGPSTSNPTPTASPTSTTSSPVSNTGIPNPLPAAIGTTSTVSSKPPPSQYLASTFGQSISHTFTAGSEVTTGTITLNHATQPADASGAPTTHKSSGLSTPLLAAVVVLPLVLLILSFAALFLLCRRRRRRRPPPGYWIEKKLMAEEDTDSTHTVRPPIQQPPPIIILPSTSSRNPAYNLGIDTSEDLSVRGSSNGSVYRATSLEEPPPPYHQPIHSGPPRRTMNALPPGHLEEQTAEYGGSLGGTLVSPFADPEDDDAGSDLSDECRSRFVRGTHERASMESDISYQRDATRVHQTV